MILRWKECIETRKIIILNVKIIARWKRWDAGADSMTGKIITPYVSLLHSSFLSKEAASAKRR
jgi:hypothetical protein